MAIVDVSERFEKVQELLPGRESRSIGVWSVMCQCLRWRGLPSARGRGGGGLELGTLYGAEQRGLDLDNLALAAPAVNRCGAAGQCGFDAGEWLPERNRCWFAARVVAVKR